MDPFIEKIANYPFVKKALKWSRNLVLPGFDGVPLFNVALFFIKGLQKGAIIVRAQSIAFRFLIALFPTIIFFFTLIPYIPITNFQQELMDILWKILPHNIYEITEPTIQDLIMNQRGGLLSFGFIMALLFSTDGINGLIEGFNSSYHIESGLGFFKQRMLSLILLLLLLVIIIVTISFIIFNEYLVSFLDSSGIIPAESWLMFVLQGIKWLIILILYFVYIAFIYYFGSNKRNKLKFISAGGTLATIFTIIVSLGFAFFVNNFGQYNKIYGSLGTLIVLMLWMYFNSIVLLIGFELNVSIQEASQKKELDL